MISDASVWLILFMPFMDFSFILWPIKIAKPTWRTSFERVLGRRIIVLSLTCRISFNDACDTLCLRHAEFLADGFSEGLLLGADCI